jgi:hypothetical protein
MKAIGDAVLEGKERASAHLMETAAENESRGKDGEEKPH